MSTSTITSIRSTFKPEERKYDLRTAEGKFFKQLNSYNSEYEVTTGVVTVNEERGYGDTATIVPVEYPAIRLVRTVDIHDDVVSTFLENDIAHSWIARDKGKSHLVVVNEVLYFERWGSQNLAYVDAFLYGMTKGEEMTKTVSTTDLGDDLGYKLVREGLGCKKFQVDSAISAWLIQHHEQVMRQQLIDDIKASFKPSHAYQRALYEANLFIEKGVKPSEGDDSSWRNHVHVAIDIEVMNMCKHFVRILGKTTDEVDTAFSYRATGSAPVIVDEFMAYATVIAQRTGNGWSSNDFSGALLGQAIGNFTKIVKSHY